LIDDKKNHKRNASCLVIQLQNVIAKSRPSYRSNIFVVAHSTVQVSTPETQTARFLQGCTTWLARYRSLTLLTLSLFMMIPFARLPS